VPDVKIVIVVELLSLETVIGLQALHPCPAVRTLRVASFEIVDQTGVRA
tara:strand:- start:1352 stop:1498 length:147 start_codon:yes stop_codon:yes gene_type:complete